MAAKSKRRRTLEEWALILSIWGALSGLVGLAVRAWLFGTGALDRHIVNVSVRSPEIDHHTVQVVKDSLSYRPKRRL